MQEPASSDHCAPHNIEVRCTAKLIVQLAVPFKYQHFIERISQNTGRGQAREA